MEPTVLTKFLWLGLVLAKLRIISKLSSRVSITEFKLTNISTDESENIGFRVEGRLQKN